MQDSEIIRLYWARSEEAIQESQLKYGAYCRTIAERILDVYKRQGFTTSGLSFSTTQ